MACCSCCACCCPCLFTHYKSAAAPKIGTDIISAHDASKHTMTGDSLPLVEITIPPQQVMISGPNAFVYAESGVTWETYFHDGSSVDEPGCCWKCCSSCKRCCCTGESMALAHFTNTSNAPKKVGFSDTIPGQIVAIDLKEVPDNMVFAMNGSFHMGAKGVRIDSVRADCIQACCGAGYLFQKLDGDGMVFLAAGGTVVKQKVENGTHRIDSSSLVAFTRGLDVHVARAGGCCTMCCGGEGMAFTTLSGSGTYWLSSSPWTEQLKHALQFLPPKKQ